MTVDHHDVILDRLFGSDPGPSRTHRRVTPKPTGHPSPTVIWPYRHPNPAAVPLADVHQQPSWVCGDCAGTGWVAQPDPAIVGSLIDVHCPTCDLDDPT